MGKLLSLGTRLKYPIVISKLLKIPGEDVKKQEAILQYKFTWMETVGDPFGETWEKERVTIADWDSSVDGTIREWKVREGMTVERDIPFVNIDESCPHSIQFAGLCGMCGKDMTETSWASREADTDRATVNMIHDQNHLTVSRDEAAKSEEESQRRLLKNKKLSLVVDLDQTIIHACIEPTVGEWQRDTSSPNYEAVKDVKSFQLNDDGGPRGLASGCWYYIKMRPGLKEFLDHVSELYELHVYTMGTRAYALNIAKIVDPEKKLFGDRIISRDENGNVTAKSLARLFPVDTKMVVIIDDRADVWPKNRPNLIKVVPYDFFLGIGDINSSFLPKREELPKITSADKKRIAQKTEATETAASEAADDTTEKKLTLDIVGAKGVSEATPKITSPAAEGKVSALEELVSMGGGNDQALRLEQAAEQEKFLEKQLTERPLLHMQEQLEKADDETDEKTEEMKNGNPAHDHHRHNLLRDDDIELTYLEQHLKHLHKAFFDEYEGALISAQGGRIAQLKPGHNKKVSLKENAADLSIVPDIGDVMPRLKAKTLAGATIVMSGLVPLGIDLLRSEIAMQAISFGANIQTKVSRKVTHVVASTSRTRTAKVRQAAKYPHIKIVNQQWLLNSMSKWEREDEEPYLVQIHQEDRQKDGDAQSVPSSVNGSDDDSEDAESIRGMSSEDDDDSVPNSQDELADDEGVMPDDIEGGISPIENLQDFDWGDVDDELKDFLESGSENESDTASVTSDTSRSSKVSVPSRKRKHDEATDDDGENSDTGSAVLRKRKRASDRSTGLKTVKTPNSATSESNLPTPGITGDEIDDENQSELEQDLEDDLEADFMAEFEREEQELAASVSPTEPVGEGSGG
ncbi:RNA polymerase ii ctd phosphatase [Phlyctema vagabunda]|uniref:RNA polymerase II subunit A C-terminal domain phosphatase n=1 Tax=Phlyctema vagabunda TaxID=108571 RepID=A0ABR4PS31_9HELO